MSTPLATTPHTTLRSTRVRVSALLALVSAVLTAILAGPAPTASAAFEWTDGQRGSYEITEVGGHRSMIAVTLEMLPRPDGTLVPWPVFSANGLVVGASWASENEQLVTATYVLQRAEAVEGSRWETIDQHQNSVVVSGYNEELLHGTRFDTVPRSGGKYRILYDVSWAEKSSGNVLATMELIPQMRTDGLCTFSACFSYDSFLVVSNP